MENMKVAYGIIRIVLVVGVVMISIGLTMAENSEFNRNKEDDVINASFMDSYLKVKIDTYQNWQDSGMSKLTLAEAIRLSYEDYYYYDDVKSFCDSVKEDSLKTKTSLKKSLVILNGFDPPNEFYAIDIKNEIEHAETLIELSDVLYSLADSWYNMIYYINIIDDDELSSRYLNEYRSLTHDSNVVFSKLNSIHEKIDVHWNSDWFWYFTIIDESSLEIRNSINTL